MEKMSEFSLFLSEAEAEVPVPVQPPGSLAELLLLQLLPTALRRLFCFGLFSSDQSAEDWQHRRR